MEETNKALPSLADLGEDFTTPLLSGPPNLETQTVQMGLLCLDAAPVPQLIVSPTLSRDVNAKAESTDLIFDLKFRCPECNKGFDMDKKLYGHMRIHQGKGYKGCKRPSIPKPKPKPRPVTYPSIYRPFTVTWSVTKKRGWKPIVDRNSPEAMAACILMILPNAICTGEPEKETSRIPLSELASVACNSSLPSHQTQERPPSSHQMEKRNVVICDRTERKSSEMLEGAKRKAKGGPHECEICGESFEMGQQLGGHKRKHYNKES